jgi:Zn finger protein HypA/HybF involved in hydrogenase expression
MPKQLTTAEFVARCREAHGNAWNYKQTKYSNKTTKIQFRCSIHGTVEQLPMNHLRIGCPYCSSGRENTHSFLKQCKRKYDYSQMQYVNNKTKIVFRCPQHGKIEQLPYEHLEIGCPRCAGKRAVPAKHTPATILKRAKQMHGDKYTYPNLVFQTIHDKITIHCPTHGDFEQRIYAHINEGQGCPQCGYDNREIKHRRTTKEFIAEARKVFGKLYDYSKVDYADRRTHVLIGCKKHGFFRQQPYLHLKGHHCPYCSGRGASKHSQQSFITIANKIHGDKYDYSKTVFERMTDNLTIICPKHGEFSQRAGNHIHLQNGCPKCANAIRTSKGEKSLLKLVTSHYDGKVDENNRQALGGQEIDVYLPDLRLGFEYHGIYWHLETVRGRKFHYNKWKLARDQGIRLIQIYDIEWLNKRRIVESMVFNQLGLSARLGARKMKIVEVPRHEKDEFLTKNHLQGSDSSKIAYGLELDGTLMACMTFGPSRFNRKYKYELVRFCTLLGHTIVGGASRLLKAFRSEHNGNIVTYADKRYSEGGLYHSIGFSLDGETQPSFSYFNLKSNTIHSRMTFQKKSLTQMKGYSPDRTEYEIMSDNGYDRIWDAGQYRFVIE